MKTTIDLTDEAAYPDGDEMPAALLIDDGDVAIVLGDVTLRLTNGQFLRLLSACNEWMAAIPAESEWDFGGPSSPPPPEATATPTTTEAGPTRAEEPRGSDPATES